MAENMGVRTLSDEDSLTDAGVLDSLAIFRLVSFLEETFSISIADEDIVMENFDSIEKINRMLTSKVGIKRA
jgi:acyl carrier protein